jgi:hypothetical protein
VCSKSFPKSNGFQTFNEKIETIENDIIKDFHSPVPNSYSNNYTKNKHLILGKKLESLYTDQLINFKTIEEKLALMREEVESNPNNFNPTEQSKLITGIDYSKIILKSRKEEIYKSYHDIQNKLSHNLSLKELFNKLKKVTLPGKCRVSKINFDKLNKELSFSINQLSELGKVESTHFIIHDNDLEYNQIHAQYDNSAKKPDLKVLRTQFYLEREDSLAKNFNFIESSNGEVKFAKFNYEDIKKSFLSVLGISWGDTKEKKQIVCDPNKITRLPARTSN